MSTTITDIRNGVARRLHGTSSNQLTDFYGLLHDAAVRCQADTDFEETRRTVPLATPVYGGVFVYEPPSDLKGDRIVSFRTQPWFLAYDRADMLGMENYAGWAERWWSPDLAVKWSDFEKKLIVDVPPKGSVVLSATTTADGWTVGGGASNLVTDNLYSAGYPSSLAFTLSGSGYIETSSISAFDLTNYPANGVAFAWVFLPSDADLSTVSFQLRWGNSDGSYFEQGTALPFDGTALTVGWNLIAFPWSGLSEIGSPDLTAVTYARLTVNVTGPATPVRVGGITFSLGQIWEIDYYSRFLFRSAAGAFKEKPTADSDLINLDTDALAVFTDCLAMLAAQQAQGKDSAFDLGFFQRQYQDSVMKYSRKNPSKAMKAGTSYYEVRRHGYSPLGRR